MHIISVDVNRYNYDNLSFYLLENKLGCHWYNVVIAQDRTSS